MANTTPASDAHDGAERVLSDQQQTNRDRVKGMREAESSLARRGEATNDPRNIEAR